MAKEVDTELFIGVDHTFRFTILDDEEEVAQNVAGWTLSWMLKKVATHPDINALITKTTASGISITGTFNSNPALNTQRVLVAIADTDSDLLTAGDRVYELKRMDGGVETILSYGALEMKRSVHHA